jgi:DNA polymerase-1
MADRPLLAVDGDSLAHRAFHALPQSITGADDRPANALVGFTNMLLSVWDAEQPRAVFVGWDTIGKPTYRHELLPGYQGGRDFAPELLEQLDRMPELCEAFGFAWAKKEGYEADDFLAAAVLREEEAGRKTTILMPKRGVREIDRVGPEEVRARYGVDPEQVPDFVALRGDSSDKIPGASGVGPQKAAAVIREYGSVDTALESGRFPQQVDELRTYVRLTRLQYEAPVPADIPDAQPDWARAAGLAETWGLGQLAGRLRERLG